MARCAPGRGFGVGLGVGFGVGFGRGLRRRLRGRLRRWRRLDGDRAAAERGLVALLVRGEELDVVRARLELPLVDEPAALLPVLGVGRWPHLVDRAADLHAHVARLTALGVAERDGERDRRGRGRGPRIDLGVDEAGRPGAGGGHREDRDRDQQQRGEGRPDGRVAEPLGERAEPCRVVHGAADRLLVPLWAGYGRSIRGRQTARYGTGVPAGEGPAATARTHPGARGTVGRRQPEIAVRPGTGRGSVRWGRGRWSVPSSAVG